MSNSATLPPININIKRWAKQSPQTNNQINAKKSKRNASMDYGKLLRRNDDRDSISSERSLSSFTPPNHVMNPLNFEAVDVKFTPLSSLRSCSEFNKQNSYSTYHKYKIDQMNNKKSYFRSFFSWASKSKTKKVKTSSLAVDEQLFLVEQLRFKPDMEKDTVTYRTKSNSTSKPNKKQETIRRQKRETGTISLMHETSLALDMVFGLNHGSNHANNTTHNSMEIELKDLTGYRSSYYDDNTSTNSNHKRVIIQNSVLTSDENQNNVMLLCLPSADSTVTSSTTYKYINKIKPIIFKQLSNTSVLCKKYLLREHTDLFYDSLRIQPFASGAYLRGFLLSGFASFFFNAYSLALWPEHNPMSLKLSTTSRVIEYLLYFLLLSQFFINMIQLPLRANIHYQCWESSRSVDVDSAVNRLRELVKSDTWVVNRGLGRFIDLLSIAFLIISECYLWFADIEDPLRMLFVSMSATNVLAFIIRMFVALSFTLSMHDPQVLSEARRRGLSRWDLDNLSTFVYTTDEELNNDDCPICLNSFDMGDMLISLSCDKKHSFHATCIRQWLQRQNSCPLCQKLV
eukprot:gene21224-27493_t